MLLRKHVITSLLCCFAFPILSHATLITAIQSSVHFLIPYANTTSPDLLTPASPNFLSVFPEVFENVTSQALGIDSYRIRTITPLRVTSSGSLVNNTLVYRVTLPFQCFPPAIDYGDAQEVFDEFVQQFLSKDSALRTVKGPATLGFPFGASLDTSHQPVATTVQVENGEVPPTVFTTRNMLGGIIAFVVLITLVGVPACCYFKRRREREKMKRDVEMIQREMEQQEAQEEHERRRQMAADYSDVAHTAPPLPPGWIEEYSEQHGQFYYYNTVTQQSVWQRPTE